MSRSTPVADGPAGAWSSVEFEDDEADADDDEPDDDDASEGGEPGGPAGPDAAAEPDARDAAEALDAAAERPLARTGTPSRSGQIGKKTAHHWSGARATVRSKARASACRYAVRRSRRVPAAGPGTGMGSTRPT